MSITIRATSLVVALPFVLFGSGCDSDSGGSGDSAMDDAVADGDGPAEQACTNEMRDDFAIGLQRTGTRLDVTIADAMPADPIRGDNIWSLSIANADGAMTDVAVKVKSWMPDHGHGSPVEAVASKVSDGEYTVEPLNLFMAGLWEITLELTLADESTEEVMFSVCVE